MSRRLWWDEVKQDFGYATRQLRRAPSFAVVAILTLGIAIGANTAVFSVINGVLLKPLHYPEPDDLSVIWTRYLPPSGFDIDKFMLSGPELLDFRESTRTLEEMGAFVTGSRTVTGDGEAAQRVRVALYSSTVFPTLGVQPEIGRWFTPEEDVAAGPAVTVISHDMWVSRFGSDPTIVGRSILMSGTATEVVGVMPNGFDFPSGTRAWIPLGLDRSSEGSRRSHSYSAIGRLASGMTQADLDSELAVLSERWALEYDHNVAHFVWSQSLHTETVSDAPGRLRLLMAAVALVLLIACANIANLLLARGERRQGEVAVRLTLGAGSGRLIRQLATESLVLAGIAAVFGLGLAQAGLRTLMAIDAEALPRLDQVRLDGTVLLFTLAVTAATAIIFSIAPAYIAGRRAAATLASSASRAVGGRRSASLRRLVVTGEVALSLVVVILAGLVVRSFSALTSTDPKMDTENLMTFSVSLPAVAYADDDLVPREYERMIEALRAIPGVTSATAATVLPFNGMAMWDFELNDRPARQDGEVAWNAGITQVATNYFETLGIPILEGRGLTPRDGRDAPLVVVVSETMADRYWPGESAIGKQLGYEIDDTVPWMTVVGLVPDPITTGLDSDPYPHLYVPQSQAGISTFFMPRALQVAVRAGIDVGAITPDVRRAVADFDADVPLYQVSTMEAIVADSFAGPRVMTNLLGVFATIALILAAVGIYGVISYSVAGRTREIGVRIALGAERGEVVRLILGEGARPVIAGVVIGSGVAWFSAGLIETMLFGIEATDPLTFSTLPVILLLTGILASSIPAMRATRIAPTEALREQ